MPRTNIRPALQERSREKRDRLIRAGLSVFSRCGYAQTRMVDVAAEASVSVGVLYQRFTDKRAFFEVIVDTLAERIERDVNDFFDEAERRAENAGEAWDLSELIGRVVATLVEMVARDVGFYLALIAVGEEVPGAIGRIAAVDHHRAQRLHAFACRPWIDRSHRDRRAKSLLCAGHGHSDVVGYRNGRSSSHSPSSSRKRSLSCPLMLVGYLQPPKT